MTRVLLVSYTHRDPSPATRLQVKLKPDLHLGLGATRLLSSQLVTKTSDLLTRDERDRILSEGIVWLKGIPKQPTDAGLFAETLLHRSVSLWWWLESPFWFGNPSDPSFEPMPRLFEAAEAVRISLESRKYDRIAFASDVHPMAGHVVADLADHYGLPVSRLPTAGPGPTILNLLRPRIVPWLLERRRRLGNPMGRQEPAVLLVSHLHALRPVGDVREDVYLGPLRTELASRRVSHAVCYVNSFADANPVRRPSGPRVPGNGFLLEQAISGNPARQVASSYRGILDAWRRSRVRMTQSLPWRGLQLSRTLGRRFDEVVRRHALTGVYYLAAFEELLRAWQPKAVVVTNETGYAGRAAVAACRWLSIPSIGVQHGLISAQHIEYINDRESTDRSLRWSSPCPDLTVLDGRYYQRIMTEVGSYPLEGTLVAGQMRYELGMKHLGNRIARVPDRIVVATHPFDAASWVVDVLTACQDAGQILIKPHPLEQADFYEDLLARNTTRGEVIGEVDLIRLLQSSAVLVSGFSTTVIEAAVADCPSIIYNPRGDREPIPFVEFGGALYAESTHDLRSAVTSVLKREESHRRLASMRPSFLEQFSYGQGAGTANRIADAVLRQIR